MIRSWTAPSTTSARTSPTPSRTARIRTTEAQDGRKTFTGELVGADDSDVTVATETGVVTIPYDPALVTGHIQFDAQKPATQRAWLRAAAAVGRGL